MLKYLKYVTLGEASVFALEQALVSELLQLSVGGLAADRLQIPLAGAAALGAGVGALGGDDQGAGDQGENNCNIVENTYLVKR